MINPEDIAPLSDFQRNAKKHIQRLRRTGRVHVLTVNGRPALIVQDARAYQRMRSLPWPPDAEERLRRSLDQANRSETRHWDEVGPEFLERVRREVSKHRVAKRRKAS